MRKKLFANWGIKLISLLVAFGLWFAVVYFKDPPVEETFNNIPVQFVNTELLTDQGLVYEVLDNTDVVRSVTVKGPKTVIAGMNADSIVATADFSEKNMSDVIAIDFAVNIEHASSISEITPSADSAQLKLFVEEKKSKSVPLNINIIGEVAEGYQLGSARTDQNRVTVTGGKSKVDAVEYAAVAVDVTGSDSDISTTETIRLYGHDDELLDNNYVQKNIGSTKATVTVLATKTVPVEFEVIGEPAEDYLLTGEVQIDAGEVMLAGSEAALAGVNSVRIPPEVLDVTGRTEDLVQQVNLKNYLPSGTQIAKDGGSGTATVTVFIEPVVYQDLKVLAENISIVNVPEGMEAEIEENYTVYDLRIKGLEENVRDVVEADLTGTADVGKWMASREMDELRPESYYVPVEIVLPEGVTADRPVEARITFHDAEMTLDEQNY